MHCGGGRSTSILCRLGGCVALVLTALQRPAGAAEPDVTIGEVRAQAPAGAFVPELRRALLVEVRRTLRSRPRERFVLSATLERLEGERNHGGVRATAAVSLVVRKEREQSLQALISGHATAEESGSDLDAARGDALRAAVESAVSRLPEAVR